MLSKTIANIIDKFDTFGINSHSLPNAIGLWPNEQECLVNAALVSNPNGNWIEIGAFCGGSAVLLALAKQEIKSIGDIVSIDNNFSQYHFYDYNVYGRGKFDYVQKIECDSTNFLNYYNKNISFAFIDGWHSFKQAYIDFENVDKILDIGGVVCFHDVSPMCYQDVKYLNEKYIEVKKNFNQYMNTGKEDFYLDEVVAFIINEYKYKLLDLEVRKPVTHFAETGLKQWVRGTTSPFNALVAIQKYE
jgi:predicted O-methyltransferase YrrM